MSLLAWLVLQKNLVTNLVYLKSMERDALIMKAHTIVLQKDLSLATDEKGLLM